MIKLKSDTITTQLTICNYESYQGERNADETPVKRKRNADETQTTPIEERKENKEVLFNDFWKIYDNQVDRKKCLEKFANMQKRYIFVGSMRHNNAKNQQDDNKHNANNRRKKS
jgi:hypothetical protein